MATQVIAHSSRAGSGVRATPPGGTVPDENLRPRLRQARFFRVLNESDLDEAAAVAQCQIRRRGELVQDRVGGSSGFYVVLSGAVRAYMLSVDGRRITLGTLSPGTAFWIEPTDLEGSATCCNEVLLDGTLLCRLPHDYVRRLMARNPQFAVEVYEVVYMWCATFRDRLRELAHDHTGTRLAHLLGRLAASSDCNVVYETHDELAWWIGTSRARVTKELHRLRGLGLIAYRPHGRGIHVLDAARLRTLQL